MAGVRLFVATTRCGVRRVPWMRLALCQWRAITVLEQAAAVGRPRTGERHAQQVQQQGQTGQPGGESVVLHRQSGTTQSAMGRMVLSIDMKKN